MDRKAQRILKVLDRRARVRLQIEGDFLGCSYWARAAHQQIVINVKDPKCRPLASGWNWNAQGTHHFGYSEVDHGESWNGVSGPTGRGRRVLRRVMCILLRKATFG